MAVGKSTVSELVAARLGIPHVALDDLARTYYEEKGYDRAHAQEVLATQGETAFGRYAKPYYVYAVERVLEDHSDCVIDFGAGHVVHDDPKLFESVEASLAPHPNVILLLPSADTDESIAILHDRIMERVAEYAEEGEDYSWAIKENKHFITHPSNGRLAKATIYTKDRSAEETCQEVLRVCRGWG
jgi:shikimate kinase